MGNRQVKGIALKAGATLTGLGTLATLAIFVARASNDSSVTNFSRGFGPIAGELDPGPGSPSDAVVLPSAKPAPSPTPNAPAVAVVAAAALASTAPAPVVKHSASMIPSRTATPMAATSSPLVPVPPSPQLSASPRTSPSPRMTPRMTPPWTPSATATPPPPWQGPALKHAHLGKRHHQPPPVPGDGSVANGHDGHVGSDPKHDVKSPKHTAPQPGPGGWHPDGGQSEQG